MTNILEITACTEASSAINPPLTLSFAKVSEREFQDVLGDVIKVSPVYSNNLSVRDSYKGYDCWVSDNGQAGFAVSPDNELVNVFSLAKGHGRSLMAFVNREYDQLHLRCLAGNNLEKFYGLNGFEITRREANLYPGKADVIFMHRSSTIPVFLM